jgi:tetratricopeptide (TPR) repeat protein
MDGPMSRDDSPGRGEPRARLRPALWLVLGAAAIQLAGCAAPAAKQEAESARTTGTSDSNLEQRLRDLQQAEALYLSGRFKEAQAAFEQLARTYPSNAEVWFRLGNTLMKQGKYDHAAAALQTAIGLDPGNGRAALNLALCRLAQAQAAMDIARGHLAAGTPERQQAEGIDRRLRSILSDPTGSDSPR